MADIYGSHFKFGDIYSRQYNLIIANVNTSRMSQLAGNKTGVTVFSKISNKRYLIDDDYSDSPISLDVEIITQSNRCLEVGERRKIEKWLFNRRDYRKLYIDVADDLLGESYEYVDGEIKQNYLNCRFINPEKLEYNGGIVGYKATLEADSNMFWQDPTVKSYPIENGSAGDISVITVHVDSDLDEYIYPKITINMGDIGGNVIISNNSDDSSRLTKFVDVSANASIIMKGELNYISGQYYEKFQDRNFVRLLDGENKLTVMGNVKSVEVEFSNRRSL